MITAPPGSRSFRVIRGRGAIFFLVLVGLLLSSGPAIAQRRLGAGGSPVASPTAAYTIRFQVYDALPSSPLVVTDKHNSAGHWRNQPSGANLVHVDDFTLLSDSGLASGDTTYRIGDTGYTAWVNGTRNFLGQHDANCGVKNANGQSVSSPYKCEEQNTTGADMDAYFVIEPSGAASHVITNNDQFNRRDVLEAWCGGDSRYASCQAVKPDNIDQTIGPFKVTSSTLVNCTTSSSSQSLAYADATSETNTIGTKLEISGKLLDLIQTKLEVSYQHAWSATHTVTKTVTINVAPGEYGWIASAQRMQNVTGSFHVVLGNQTYDVDNVTITAPLASDDSNIWVTKTEKIADKDGVCAGKGGSNFFQASPLAPVGGGLYDIGVVGSNQHVVEAPGGSRDAVALKLGQFADGQRGQQWRFIESSGNPDYFIIQSDNNPNMCLNLSGTDARTIYQWPCQTPVSDNELWTVRYDPGAKGYEVMDKSHPDKALATDAGNLAVGTDIIAAAADTARRWVFTRAG
jgi:hypothetical protein